MGDRRTLEIGRMGERFFGIWCDSIGLNANRPEFDITGWDFIVEFPSQSNDKMLPRDMIPTPIECKVQVKSTDHRKGEVPIKISNLERFVKSKLPTFFCFIEFDEKNVPQAAYLVHVGREIIEKTLKRIRKLYSEEKGEELNQHTMLIKYTNNDQFTTNGKGLKSAIEKHIPGTLEDYTLEKKKYVETLGFENGKGQLKIQVSGRDPIGDLVNLSLGIQDNIHVDKSTAYDQRFGILSENSSLSFEGGMLSIKTETEPVILQFKEHDFSSEKIILKANLYLSFLSQSLPQKHTKLRVKSTMFDLIFFNSIEKMKCSFEVQENHKYCLDDLKNNLQAFTLIQKSSKPSVLEIIDETKQLPTLSLSISINDQINHWSDVCDIAKMASLICKRFSISEEKVLVTLDELRQASNSIKSFSGILSLDPKKVNLEFPPEFKDYEQGSKCACTFSIITDIGNHTIVCFLAIIGVPSLGRSTRYTLVAENILAGNELIFIDDEIIIEQSMINDKFDDFEEKLQKREFEIIRIPAFDDFATE